MQGHIHLLTSCHVDNTQIVGHPNNIQEFINGSKEQFVIKELGPMKKHLGISYNWIVDDKGSKVKAALNDLISEIIEMREKFTNCEVIAKRTPAPQEKMLQVHENKAELEARMY